MSKLVMAAAAACVLMGGTALASPGPTTVSPVATATVGTVPVQVQVASNLVKETLERIREYRERVVRRLRCYDE